ncbi:ATP-binding protein [Bdellovibrionota bacterium FG-2]
MKTKAFLIRVAVCFFLSLIPLTELENRIYSARIALRGHLMRTTKTLLVDVESNTFNSPKLLNFIADALRKKGARLVITDNQHSSRDLIIDSDGVVRTAILLPKGGSSITFKAYLQSKQDPKALSQLRSPHLINFVGEAGSFRRCQVTVKSGDGEMGAENLNISHDCPSFQGKSVILSEDSDYSPILRTPFGEMGRAEVIANDIETIVDGNPILRAGFAIQAILVLLMVFIASFYIVTYPVLISSIAVTGTGVAVAVILFQIIFQAFDIYIPSANVGASLLITYLVFTGFRQALQENLQWRALKQSQYLRELDQMKTNFLSLVSHDLKTPIAKIQAVVERLRRESHLPPEEHGDWKELFDSIENSNNELKNYITSILNLSRIESQKVILNMKSNDINLLIQQALKRLRPIAQQKNISIEESLEPLFSIECDEDLMRQVLTNLIDNAIKYSPANSNVIVRSFEEEGFVKVEVEDFGPGIPKDQLPQMFRKFSRLVRPLKEQVKGTGLGLYLSKYFIELHGGSIRVQSTEGKGTTFSFSIPVQTPHPEESTS